MSVAILARKEWKVSISLVALGFVPQSRPNEGAIRTRSIPRAEDPRTPVTRTLVRW